MDKLILLVVLAYAGIVLYARRYQHGVSTSHRWNPYARTVRTDGYGRSWLPLHAASDNRVRV